MSRSYEGLAACRHSNNSPKTIHLSHGAWVRSVNRRAAGTDTPGLEVERKEATAASAKRLLLILLTLCQTPRHPRPPRAATVDAKDFAATLVRDVGFEPVDAGLLRIARYMKPFALLMGQLAYEGDEGPEIAYHIERFGK